MKQLYDNLMKINGTVSDLNMMLAIVHRGLKDENELYASSVIEIERKILKEINKGLSDIASRIDMEFLKDE